MMRVLRLRSQTKIPLAGFDPDLLLFLKPCEHLLDDPPRYPVPADQLADREKTLRHDKTVQLRLQRFVQAIRPMLNIT